MSATVHVLLVDDEPDFVEPLAFWLQAKGYRVSTAANGREAVQRVKQDSPDIIFLDIHMKEMDGLEALRQIRAFNRDLPVIMVTATGHVEENFRKAKELGVSGFFPKHTSLSELSRIIEASLRSHVKLKSSKTDQ